MQTVISVEQLSKSYGNLLAVDKISLSVKHGTVYGLLGANGSGKSTTIECILGTKNADSGTISVLGCNPKKDRHCLFQNVGFQFQEGDYQPEICILRNGRAVFFATVEQAKTASQCESFEDAYLMLSGGEVEKE